MNILETILSHDTVVPMKKLTDVTVEEDVAALTIDTSGNAWGAYHFVVLDFEAANPESDTFTVLCNSSSNTSTHSLFGQSRVRGLSEGNWTNGLTGIFLTGMGLTAMEGFTNTNALWNSRYEETAAKLNSITFVSKNNPTSLLIKAGSRIRVWGVL